MFLEFPGTVVMHSTVRNVVNIENAKLGVQLQ